MFSSVEQRGYVRQQGLHHIPLVNVLGMLTLNANSLRPNQHLASVCNLEMLPATKPHSRDRHGRRTGHRPTAGGKGSFRRSTPTGMREHPFNVCALLPTTAMPLQRKGGRSNWTSSTTCRMPYVLRVFAPTSEVWGNVSWSRMAKLELDLNFAYSLVCLSHQLNTAVDGYYLFILYLCSTAGFVERRTGSKIFLMGLHDDGVDASRKEADTCSNQSTPRHVLGVPMSA